MTRRFGPLLETGWPIAFNAGSLMAAIVVNSGLGFVFWWLAARTFSPSEVGFAAAAVSAMTLLGTLGVLGLGTLLIGELPRRAEGRGSLITTALSAAGVAGAVLGIAFALLAGVIAPDLAPLGESLGITILFALGASLTAATLVLDQALIGLLRGGLQFLRNALFSLAKLGALAIAVGWSGATAMTIYGAWVVGAAIAVAVVLIWLAATAGGPLRTLLPHKGQLRGLGRPAVAHHALNVALQATGQLMPLVVTAILSATANAYFYTAAMVAYLAYIGPVSLATVFYAVGSADAASLVHRLRVTLGLSLVVAVVANATLLLVASPILGLFGESYARAAAVPLQLLGLQAFTFIVREHYVATRRVEGRPASAAPLVLAGSGLKLVLAAVGASAFGLTGLAVGVLIAAGIEALVMGPTVYRVATGRQVVRQPVSEGRPPTDSGAVAEWTPPENPVS